MDANNYEGDYGFFEYLLVKNGNKVSVTACLHDDKFILDFSSPICNNELKDGIFPRAIVERFWDGKCENITTSIKLSREAFLALRTILNRIFERYPLK